MDNVSNLSFSHNRVVDQTSTSNFIALMLGRQGGERVEEREGGGGGGGGGESGGGGGYVRSR